METAQPDRPPNHGQIIWGVLIIAAGLLMLIDRLDLADVHLTTRIWPIVPLGLGLLRFIDPQPPREGLPRSRRPGAWLLFIGCWGLLNEFHVRGLDYHNSWPLLVVFAGITLVWRSAEAPARGPCGGPMGQRRSS